MIAFDTNILVYGQQQGDDPRHTKSVRLLYAAALGEACIPTQVLGELINVCIRKLGIPPVDAIEQVEEYARLFHCPETRLSDLTAAALLASERRLQFFDALIITVAQRSGATLLLSEDMQNGLVLDGLTIINPFNPDNAERLRDLLDD